MKHAAFIQEDNGAKLKDKVEKWISENEDSILEIVGIEYGKMGTYIMWQ